MSVNAPVNVNEPLAPCFDHERLEAYQRALDFHIQVCALLPRRGRAVRDQLERASLSVVLNIAEGAGRTSPGDKRRFYEMARGSATESAAALDVLQRRGLLESERHRVARDVALRLVQMLSRLCMPRI